MGESGLVSLVVLVDSRESYEFMLRCPPAATVLSLLCGLEKNYHAAVRQRPLFRDKLCTLPAPHHEPVAAAARFYLAFSKAEYENIVKSLFFAKPPAKPEHKQPPSQQQEANEQQEAPNQRQNDTINQKGNLSTAEAKVESKPPAYREVSSFRIGTEENDDNYAVPKANEVVVAQPYRQAEGGGKVNPEADTSHNFLTTDSIAKPPVVEGGGCCALI